ncbi:Uma2 family endonuclease [Streptomyces sp. NPDC057638]|uniref:Uma2 family endonuclease n=1 Tax=Streptomyces sp. NPDC057638 TaxID=3346190 RepID=UPI0036AD9776
MTVLFDRIEMAGADDSATLDEIFASLEKLPVPEGYKVEVIGGTVVMSPQRQSHWEIIATIFEQLRVRYPRKRTASDVRIDFPGHLNGFACDLVAFAEGAAKDAHSRWHYAQIEFVMEVISESTAANDYGPKKDGYATAEVPVYLIVDPYTQTWHLHTLPRDGAYRGGTRGKFGEPVDLTGTPVELVLATDEFPVD